jgi:2'-5' RNA ligase
MTGAAAPGETLVGVTIELPEPFYSELAGWRERLGDPSAAFIPPHITLLPPTAMDPAELSKFSDHLATVAATHDPFRVRLSGSDTFRPVSPVVFVSLVEGAECCTKVQAAVRSGPVSRELPFPYHPHVTVAHDLPAEALDRAYAALAGYEAEFEARGFALHEQDAAGHWLPGREFTFGQPFLDD